MSVLMQQIFVFMWLTEPKVFMLEVKELFENQGKHRNYLIWWNMGYFKNLFCQKKAFFFSLIFTAWSNEAVSRKLSKSYLMEALKFFNLALENLVFSKRLALSYTAFTCRFKFKYELRIKMSIVLTIQLLLSGLTM